MAGEDRGRLVTGSRNMKKSHALLNQFQFCAIDIPSSEHRAVRIEQPLKAFARWIAQRDSVTHRQGLGRRIASRALCCF
jgi:hypothetical protein